MALLLMIIQKFVDYYVFFFNKNVRLCRFDFEINV